MSYTPDQIAQADQALAGIHHQLAKLTTLADSGAGMVQDVDELAEILRDTLTPDELAVTLAAAVYELAKAHQQ